NIAESLNARIAAEIGRPPGLAEAHLLAAVDWALYYRWVAPKPPKQIYTQWDQTGRPRRRIIPNKPKKNIERIGPARYDTHAVAEEGLWTRKGWAGRSNYTATRRLKKHIFAGIPHLGRYLALGNIISVTNTERLGAHGRVREQETEKQYDRRLT